MGLNLRNCPNCGKLYAKKSGHDVCPVCADSVEEDFKKVKDFLWDNPNATIEMVHSKTEVSRERIIKFIRDDRLIAEGLDLDFVVECERCGKLISHGRFCENCQDELVSGLSSGNKKIKKKKSPKDDSGSKRMYLYERINKRNR